MFKLQTRGLISDIRPVLPPFMGSRLYILLLERLRDPLQRSPLRSSNGQFLSNHPMAHSNMDPSKDHLLEQLDLSPVCLFKDSLHKVDSLQVWYPRAFHLKTDRHKACLRRDIHHKVTHQTVSIVLKILV